MLPITAAIAREAGELRGKLRIRKRTLRKRDVLELFQAQGDRANLQTALALKIYAEANQACEIDHC